MLHQLRSGLRGRAAAYRGPVFAAGLIGYLLMAATPSSAGVLFTSFVSGTTYPCCNGDSITGPSATIGGTPLGPANLAAMFTPVESAGLAQIDVAMWALGSSFGDPDTTVFNLSLNEDSGGLPGLPIATWIGINAPSPFTLPIETVFPAAPVSLISGQTYWLVASAPDPATFVVWNMNATAGGPGGSLAVDSGAGWVPFSLTEFNVAFDVLGTAAAPEPAAFGVSGIALFGFAFWQRRRSRPAILRRPVEQ